MTRHMAGTASPSSTVSPRAAAAVLTTPLHAGSASADPSSIWVVLIGFYALTLAISWGWMLPFVLAGSVVPGQRLAIPYACSVGADDRGGGCHRWTQGARGVRDLGRRIVRWRVGLRWWFWGLGTPLAYFAAGVVIARLSDGQWSSFTGLDQYSGIPAIGVFGVWLAAIVGGVRGGNRLARVRATPASKPL